MKKRKKEPVRKVKPHAEWRFAVLSLLLLVIFTLFVYSRTFSSLKLYIDDADPYSYRATIPPMFLITLIFFYRNDLKVGKDATKLLFALPFLILAVVMLFTSNLYPYSGLDVLSLPLFVAGGILLFFSITTLEKLLFPVLYLFLLWTPLFQPLVSTQLGITNFTSDIVFIPIMLSGLPIERDGNIFYSGSKVSLEVVPECVPLSAMIALFCFLLPFAYVARGETKNRLAWLATWVAGGWLLNVVRILVVLLIWYYSGISLALQVFHSLGGNIIFDIVLIASLLSISLFRLEFRL